jgi:hypothetical protein
MTVEVRKQEKDRFNSISQEEAKRIAAECDGAEGGIRSCWHCNGAHDHLKERDYFTCFVCGISYVRGIPTPLLGKLMRGEEVTEEDMDHFQEALEAKP